MFKAGRKFGVILFAACTAACLLTGCRGEAPEPKATTGSAEAESALPPVPPSISKQPTEEQCLQVARLVEQSISSGDVAAGNNLFAWDALLADATAGFDDSANLRETRNEFIIGFKKSMTGSGGLIGSIGAAVEKGGSYRYLRTHTTGGEKRILFRLVLPDGGVNYHDFVVTVMPDEQVQIRDAYVFLMGEKISQMCRRSFLPVAQEASRGILGRLTGRESEFLQSVPRIKLLTNQLRNEQYAAALENYNGLPESVRSDKTVLLLRLQAAQAVDDGEYLAAIDDFQTFHPDDACIHMIAIDGFILRGRYDKALESIDKLARAIQGDPYLDVMRARVFLEQGDYKSARKLAQTALAADSTLLDAYWVLVATTLAGEEFDTTVALLDTIEKKFNMQFLEFEALPEYAAFVKSPQYDEWKRSRSEK